MIQQKEKPGRLNKADTPYQKIVNKIKSLYGGKISDTDAHEAARNLIGFCQLLLEMQAKQDQNRKKGV